MQEFGLPIWAIILIAIALLMLLTDIGKAYTFSEMRLEITYQGKPAAGAIVKRRIKWQRERLDEFFTDSNGVVVLPQVRERSITQFFPSQFISSQLISVNFRNQNFEVWSYVKIQPDKNSEMGGYPLNLECELTRESKLDEEFDTLMITNCKKIPSHDFSNID
ncbi:hypothetical protein GNX18_14010 [Microbulbifer sp. SH-1]|uniref:DUF6795 domain-containing protein n=1 Tax=Microbulbifer sp. SH-1 TaxID=2681547 RepID=UPI00140E65A3|nr:DUF6795 domain-containing protein [Microbulbifer sp. SH-1]QIL90755.1 hypothetical protein GNX18_14010 [Microbulbifer sp. SH-1]